ncbi:MAG TPA: hypothetical protein DF984_08055 [Anaerolineaceae bacterium]|nr:hypothetical protein [Anaerolineaceae bacterium]
MVSIAEFSDEPIFTIKVVCERTGIKPVTLRAWERRYNLLDPSRLENNYRLYSDRDIQILRWITHRLENGLTISRAVREYHELRLNGIWPEALPILQTPVLRNPPKAAPKEYSEQLFTAITSHNEIKARQIIDTIQSVFNLETIFFEIFNPCLYEIGEAWYRGEIRIATEHYASGFIRGFLMNLLQAFPVNNRAPKLLVGCAPEEFHEIGPLMLSVLLRREGYQVEFLGSDLPVDDLVAYAEDISPDMVILSAGFEHTARPLFQFQEKLNKLSPKSLFGFGGRYFNENSSARDAMQGVFLGSTLAEAIRNVHDLMD